MMNILAVETSCGKASVAIYSEKKIVAFCQNEKLNMQAEELFPLIDQAFEIAGLNYNNLSHICTTTGPGSFTGIRIGLSAVRGITIAAGHIMQIGFSNFEVMAFRSLRQVANVKNIVVIFECSPTTIYVQRFNESLQAIYPPELIEVSSLDACLSECKGITALAGNGIKLFSQALPESDDLIILPRYPKMDARLLISLASYKIRFNKLIDNKLEPVYVKSASTRIG